MEHDDLYLHALALVMELDENTLFYLLEHYKD